MTRPHFTLASGLCSFTAMALAGMTSARAEVVYVDEGAYAVPPAYVAPIAPPSYYVAPEGYVAAPAYTVPTVPLAVVPVAPPAYAPYATAPAYVERVVPAITPRERVIRRARPAYPRYDYGYVTYDEW